MFQSDFILPSYFKRNVLLYLIFLTPFLTSITLKGQIQALPNAHAHNDYEHERPLLDALQNGFTSVEADVHLIDGELYVVHDRPENPDPARTLVSLYLEPLRERVLQNSGKVYSQYDGPFYLMIDIKTAAEPTYEVIQRQLKAFTDMLAYWQDGLLHRGAVTVFLSGNRPFESVLRDENRMVALDGRPSNLGEGFSSEIMPVISDHYRRHLQWTGEGEIPEEERLRLRDLVLRTHAEGKLLRLWASPENEAVWEVLFTEGVDLINTDKLEELRDFLLER